MKDHVIANMKMCCVCGKAHRVDAKCEQEPITEEIINEVVKNILQIQKQQITDIEKKLTTTEDAYDAAMRKIATLEEGEVMGNKTICGMSTGAFPPETKFGTLEFYKDHAKKSRQKIADLERQLADYALYKAFWDNAREIEKHNFKTYDWPKINGLTQAERRGE